jgi:hypothetical protein
MKNLVLSPRGILHPRGCRGSLNLSHCAGLSIAISAFAFSKLALSAFSAFRRQSHFSGLK